MNICIIANGYPTLDSPQFGCFEREQAVALKKMGHELNNDWELIILLTKE